MDGIINSMDMSLSKLWELVMEREACHAAVHRISKNWTRLRDGNKELKVTEERNIKGVSVIRFGFLYVFPVHADDLLLLTAATLYFRGFSSPPCLSMVRLEK